MKVGTLLLTVSLLVSIASTAHSQVVTYDSVYANTIVAFVNVGDTGKALGKPDAAQATLLGNGSQLDLGFTFNHSLLTFDSGATIHITWNNESPGDTVAGFLQFFNLSPFRQDTHMYLLNHPGMETVKVPASGLDYLEFTLTGSGFNIGSHKFYIDGVTLLQRVTAGVHDNTAPELVLESYPNPFVRTQGTTLHLDVPQTGNAVIHVFDLLGREVKLLPIGVIGAGSQEVRLALDEAGVFLARLAVDGNYVGAPLKITSE